MKYINKKWIYKEVAKLSLIDELILLILLINWLSDEHFLSYYIIINLIANDLRFSTQYIYYAYK